MGAQSRIAHPPHQNETDNQLVVSTLVDGGRSWLDWRLGGARSLHSCFVTLVLGGGVFHTTTSGLLGVHLRLLLVGGAGGGDLGLVLRVDVVLLVVGLRSEAILRALRVAVSLALRGVRCAVLLAAWRGDVGLAFLRCKQLGTLVSDVGTDSEEFPTLIFFREGKDKRGKVLLLGVALDGGQRLDDEATGGKVVVHFALASLDSYQCEPVEQRVDVRRLLLPLLVCFPCSNELLLRGLRLVEQRNKFRCHRVDLFRAGHRVRLEPGVELDDVDARFCQDGIANVGCVKDQVRDTRQRIFTDRLLELVADLLGSLGRERCAQRVGPLTRIRHSLERTNLVLEGDQTEFVSHAYRIGSSGFDGQCLDDCILFGLGEFLLGVLVCSPDGLSNGSTTVCTRLRDVRSECFGDVGVVVNDRGERERNDEQDTQGTRNHTTHSGAASWLGGHDSSFRGMAGCGNQAAPRWGTSGCCVLLRDLPCASWLRCCVQQCHR